MNKFFKSFILVMVITMLQGAMATGNETTVTMKIDSPTMSINGVERQIDTQGTAPVIKNGRTLVPLRAIFEALSVEVAWDDATKTVTAIGDDVEVRLTVGSATAYKNGDAIALDVAPQIINGRTMIPLRFAAESLGAEVSWDNGTRTIVIVQKAATKKSEQVTETEEATTEAVTEATTEATTEAQASIDERYIALGGNVVHIGDNVAKVEEELGKANRIDVSGYNFDWHVYNSDYSRFIMVGIKDGVVEALYTNTKGFETNGGKYGDKTANAETGVSYYTDEHEGSIIHACFIKSSNVKSNMTFNESFYKAQEQGIFDMTNAYRVNHGLTPYKSDAIAEKIAQDHSKDMASKNYFDHESQDGSLPIDRFTKAGGRASTSWGENITAGSSIAIDAFQAWVDSSLHRGNMLKNDFTYMGVGYGYSSSAEYKSYMTQFFFS